MSAENWYAWWIRCYTNGTLPMFLTEEPTRKLTAEASYRLGQAIARDVISPYLPRE